MIFNKLVTFTSLAGLAVVDACSNIIVSPGASLDSSSIMVSPFMLVITLFTLFWCALFKNWCNEEMVWLSL